MSDSIIFREWMLEISGAKLQSHENMQVTDSIRYEVIISVSLKTTRLFGRCPNVQFAEANMEWRTSEKNHGVQKQDEGEV